ncbi:MAG TPA: UDP-N-acetylmuramate dehydrogenase [Flavisolibacter sp.]|jgi:UDP-N-acetylmuramate dehydrogenase|nr:UDP-N-acetylmuramate dehydrogenase [Flavisolibacter sp.]
MQIRENISLRSNNTFGIDATARYFASFQSLEELEAIVDSQPYRQQHTLILGGGSNILLTQDVDGLVMKNEIGGIAVVKEDDEHIYVRAGGGVNWHRFVMYCVENGFAGAENLSLIPGNVGASPMQNIGAYGVEIKDIFHELEAYHLKEKTVKQFSLSECEFGYRESIFKRKYKGQFIITSVTYRLNKKPVFHTSYGAIQQELEKMGIEDLSIKAISDAVIRIRSSKLPDPKQVGNAGSFFKNPAVEKTHLATIQQTYPDVPAFPLDADHVKVPAGWLIEQCGWKGFRRGDAGCYPKQALVLVNYGKATGNEIYTLSEEILQSVKNRFGIELEREVNIL